MSFFSLTKDSLALLFVHLSAIKCLTAHSTHATKIPFMYSQKRNCAASVQIATFICLWAIYIFPGLVHIFSCSRIGRPIVWKYNSLTDIWMLKLGQRPRNFFSGNICFKFSVLSLCSAVHFPPALLCVHLLCNQFFSRLATRPTLLTPLFRGIDKII